MRITHKYALPALLALSLGTVASADEEGTFFGQDATGNWILGIKGGVLQNNDESFGDATNLGAVLGYRFSRAIGGIGGSSSIEFEATTSIDDGDFGPTGGGTWSANTYALFFTYSTPGTVYFKGKLGGMITDLSTSAGASSDDTGFAYGAGLGVKLGKQGKLEAEYTGTTGSNELTFISLGGLVEF